LNGRFKWIRNLYGVLYVVVMIGVIVSADLLLFFRNRFWERLIVNIGIVLVFGSLLFEIPKETVSYATLRQLIA